MMSDGELGAVAAWVVARSTTGSFHRVRLRYIASRPWEVEMSFTTQARTGSTGLRLALNPVVWSVSRMLLNIGMQSTVSHGLGDIRVWVDDQDTAHFALTSPAGHIELMFESIDIDSFLLDSFEIVAPGEEDDYAVMPDDVGQFIEMAGESWAGGC